MTINVDVDVIQQTVDVAANQQIVEISAVGQTVEIQANQQIIEIIELGSTSVEINNIAQIVDVGPVGTIVEISAVGVQGPPGQDGAPGQIVSDKYIIEQRFLSALEVANEALVLGLSPSAGVIPLVQMQSGSVQIINVDYIVVGNTISWSGFGMAALGLVAGDGIVITYVID
jgi:hypothetical protein